MPQKQATRKVAKYLVTAELAERYRTSDSTIRYWRMIGYGPKGVKVGRKVLYPIVEVEQFDEWLVSQGGAA